MPVERTTPTSTVIQQILADCAAHIAHSRSALRRDPMDSQAVHDLRVSSRKARSVLALFKPHLVAETRKSSNRQLRELAGLFRESREWDVLKSETMPTACSRLLDDHDLRQYYADLWNGVIERSQTGAHGKAAKAEIDMPIIVFPKEIVTQAPTPIFETAPALLRQQAKSVRRRLRYLDSPDERHDARKAIKRLRYSIEFLDGVFPAAKVAAYLLLCNRLHKILGEMSDLHMTMVLFDRKAMPEQAVMEKWVTRRTKRLLNRLDPAVRKFRKAEHFWLVVP